MEVTQARPDLLAPFAPADDPQTFKAAYLVDPVDVTQFSPESLDNPSATRALAGSHLQVGITGAGIIGSCNPAESGYKVRSVGMGQEVSFSAGLRSSRKTVQKQQQMVGWVGYRPLSGGTHPCTPTWLQQQEKLLLCFPVQSMWPAAGTGSWLSVLPGASHSQFADGGWAVNMAAGELGCLPLMVAWYIVAQMDPLSCPPPTISISIHIVCAVYPC